MFNVIQLVNPQFGYGSKDRNPLAFTSKRLVYVDVNPPIHINQNHMGFGPLYDRIFLCKTSSKKQIRKW